MKIGHDILANKILRTKLEKALAAQSVLAQSQKLVWLLGKEYSHDRFRNYNVTVAIDPHAVEMNEVLNGLESGYGMDIEINQMVSLDADQVRQLLEVKIDYLEQYAETQSTMSTRYCELKNKAEAEPTNCTKRCARYKPSLTMKS